MEPLEAPTVLNKVHRQPIEQLRMRRRLSQVTEVTWSRYDPLAKMLLPDAVDDDARGQWVVGLANPLRQRGSSD